MTISDLETFFAQNVPDGREIHGAEKQDELHKRFPHVVVTEGRYPEVDFAHRWCWRRFGPPSVKECADHQSEYPACPLVLATEYIGKWTWKGKELPVKRYKAPEKHGHDGTWTTFWLGKTDYNYGFMEFCFSRLEDKEAFLVAAPSMRWGEKYDDLKED